MVILCVDIGGTNTLIGVGNGDFEEVGRLKTERFLQDIEANLDRVLNSVDSSRKDVGKVAVAAAGPMDRDQGVFYPPNLSNNSELDKVQIEKHLSKFGDLRIVNDCSAAVKGEYEYGESAEDMVYITISSGIGLGAIFDGKLVEGAQGNFGEIGHMKINGELECGCGGKGHWEAYCSGNRLPEMAEELFDADFQDAVEIFDQYYKEDSQAEKVVEKMQQVNRQALINVINLYNPEKIVLGGPVVLNHREIMIEDIKQNLEDEAVNKVPEIVSAELEDQSVLQGLKASITNP